MVRCASSPDAVLVIPPPSPSDTNLPLGPALLRAEAHESGFDVRLIDLNIEYIRRNSPSGSERVAFALGDHGKDRNLVRQAASRLFEVFGFGPEDLLFVPLGAHGAEGMHVTDEALARRTQAFVEEQHEFTNWIRRRVLGQFASVPAVVGVSIMGPSQVFLALVIADLVKATAPGTRVVFGGTHMTLLRSQWERGELYRRGVDLCLFGHAEREFVRVIGEAVGQASPECAVSA